MRPYRYVRGLWPDLPRRNLVSGRSVLMVSNSEEDHIKAAMEGNYGSRRLRPGKGSESCCLLVRSFRGLVFTAGRIRITVWQAYIFLHVDFCTYAIFDNITRLQACSVACYVEKSSVGILAAPIWPLTLPTCFKVPNYTATSMRLPQWLMLPPRKPFPRLTRPVVPIP